MTNGKIFLTVLFFVALLTGFVFWQSNPFFVPVKNQPAQVSLSKNQSPQNSGKASSDSNQTDQAADRSSNYSAISATDFLPPLTRASERVTKKPFGIFITPQTSPVQPERFQGYHTGVDFEIFPSELNADVSVSAICSGKLLLKKYATGYGGVAVESCTLDGSPVTVVYGHLKLDSITASSGDKILAGDTVGILGADKSAETDGERKHLHLGIHKGNSVNILGYVQDKVALTDWLDPCLYVCQK